MFRWTTNDYSDRFFVERLALFSLPHGGSNGPDRHSDMSRDTELGRCRGNL
jgi:hypothetical protein